MKEYDVKITETLEKTVTVQAESRDAAEEQVKDAYYNSEHILDAENFTGVQFGTQAEREIQEEQAPMMDVLLVRPNMYPQAAQVGCELEDLQKAVGGYIQAVYPFEEPVALVMDEEAKLTGKDLIIEQAGDMNESILQELNQIGFAVDQNRGNVLAQVLFKVVAQPVLLVNGKLTFVNQEDLIACHFQQQLVIEAIKFLIGFHDARLDFSKQMSRVGV